MAVANLCGCNKDNTISFSTNINEVITKINQNPNYSKYIDVIMKKPVILPIKDNQGNQDPDNCHISENLIFKNITNEKIKFNCKIFLAKEFITSIAYAPTSFGLNQEITLEPGQSADIAGAIIMKKIESLAGKEKDIYDEYSGKVYVELKINNDFYSFIQMINSN